MLSQGLSGKSERENTNGAGQTTTNYTGFRAVFHSQSAHGRNGIRLFFHQKCYVYLSFPRVGAERVAYKTPTNVYQGVVPFSITLDESKKKKHGEIRANRRRLIHSFRVSFVAELAQNLNSVRDEL